MKIIAANIEDFCDADAEKAEENLPLETRQRVRRFRFKNDYKRSLLGEIMIRCLSVRCMGDEYKKIHIVRNQYGKPCIANCKDAFVNVSHSGNWAVCAFDCEELGIDIEQNILPGKNTDSLAKEILSGEEYRYFLSLNDSEKNLALTKYWTMKESFTKYDGQGLQINIKDIQIPYQYNRGEIIYHNKKCAGVYSLIYDGNYYFSCCKRNIGNVRIEKIEMGDLLGCMEE